MLPSKFSFVEIQCNAAIYNQIGFVDSSVRSMDEDDLFSNQDSDNSGDFMTMEWAKVCLIFLFLFPFGNEIYNPRYVL